MQTLVPVAIAAVGSLMGNKHSHTVEYRTDPALLQRLEEMAKNSEAIREEARAAKEAQLRAIEAAEGHRLDAAEKQRMLDAMQDPQQYSNMKQANFKNLIANLHKYPIEASMPEAHRGKVNVGFIGLTCCGKSSLLNTLARREVAETGMDETTKEYRVVHTLDQTNFWDFPGLNDRVDYFDIHYIALIKAFSMMYVLYDNDLQVCLNLLRLLQALKVPFALIRTKCDNDENEAKTNLLEVASKLRDIRKKEDAVLTANGISPLPKVYHVSCRNVQKNMRILDYAGRDETVGGLYDWQQLLTDITALRPTG